MLSRSPRSKFFRDGGALVAGSVVAQAVAIAAMPVVTRLYDQAQFGVFGAFAGVVGLLSQAACLRYEQAIVIARDEEVSALVRLSLIVLAVTTCAGFALVGLANRLAGVIETDAYEACFWLAPLAVALVASFQIAQALLSRRGRFVGQSAARVAKSTSEAVAQIGFAVVSGASALGLVVGNVLGVVAQSAVLLRGVVGGKKPTLAGSVSATDLLGVARRYVRFPVYATPAGFAGALGQHGLTLVVALYAGVESAGLFFLAHRVLSLPSALVSQAISPAVYKHLSERRGSPRAESSFIASVFVTLLIIGVTPFAAAAWAGQSLFVTFFGSQWAESGVVFQVIWPAYLMMFCVLPITQAFFVYERQASGFVWQVVGLGARIASFCVGYHFGGLGVALGAYGIATSISYAAVVVMALHWAGCPPQGLPHAIRDAFLGLVSRFALPKAA